MGPTRRSLATREAWIRVALGVLLALVALNAFAGGSYGMAGAPGVPTAWLDGSAFSTYFVPGLALFVVVGGTFLLAAVTVLARSRLARPAAVGAAVIALGWLVVQVAVIGMVSWLQPVTALAALVVLMLASQLRAGPPLA